MISKTASTGAMRLAAFLLICVSLTHLRAAVEPERVREDVTDLQERHVIADPNYWLEHVVQGGKCDGAKVATLLVELAKALQPTENLEQALKVLVHNQVIGTPDYWQKNAQAGAECSGTNVAIVLTRLVSRLPGDPPKSATATPLEPTPVAKLQDKYDVIIAGAGTGGCGAAVQAARMGCSVLLLEETDWIGGQMNAAAVTSMDEGGTLVRQRGLYREWCGLISSYYQPLGINSMTAYWNGHPCVEPRVGRHLLHVLLGDARGSGVLDLALRARVTSVTKDGDAVTGVTVEDIASPDKASRTIACRVLIDGTEWGDVIPLTGARYRVGNCTNDHIIPERRVQDNTWTAVVTQYPNGVPADLMLHDAPPGYTAKTEANFARTLADGDKIDIKAKPWTWATFIGYRGMPDSSRSDKPPGITRTHLNSGNDYPSTVAEIEDPARRLETNRAMQLKTLYLLYFIQHSVRTDWAVANDEGFDTPCRRAEVDAWLKERADLLPYRAVLYHFSIMPYVRESRRIIGLHTLTAHEIERKPGRPIQFAHTVALGDYPVDMHGSMSNPYLELDLESEDAVSHDFHQRGSGPFAIPFESFIPETLDGFLPAEKNFSQSRMVNGATRLQPHTMNMGQAVGAIAALAVKSGAQPRAVDPALVQQTLLEAGCTLSIAPIDGARWGTPAWRQKQVEILKSGAAAK
jgi:hypothetical protein